LGKIIAVANQKGGVGKTTTAVNLSACIASTGRSVLLLDMDPQSNATSGLGLDKKNITLSIYDALINELPIAQLILPTQIKALSLCPSNIKLAGAEVELVTAISRENKLKVAIEPIKKQFDYIIIDCPPSLGLLTVNSLTAAHSLLVPVQCEYYALEGISQLMDTFKLIKKYLNKDLELEGIVLTMFSPRTKLSIQVAEEIKKHFGPKVFDAVIPKNVRLSEAPSHGLPIILYDPKSKGAECYIELTQTLLDCCEVNKKWRNVD